jgi:hypothetical protein
MDSIVTIQGFITLSTETHKIIDVPIMPPIQGFITLSTETHKIIDVPIMPPLELYKFASWLNVTTPADSVLFQLLL